MATRFLDADWLNLSGIGSRLDAVGYLRINGVRRCGATDETFGGLAVLDGGESDRVEFYAAGAILGLAILPSESATLNAPSGAANLIADLR